MLGFSWEFINTDNQIWHDFGLSDERREYFTTAGNQTAIPHIQDFLAIRELIRKGKINSNAVVVPGHSADLLAGSRSKSQPWLYKKSPLNIKKVVDAIALMNYNFVNLFEKKSCYLSFARSRIISSLGDTSRFDCNASAYEFWDINERQSKFIVNSVRVYSYFNLDWWLPFWERPFYSFWGKIPINYRMNKFFYDQYVNKLSHKYNISCNFGIQKPPYFKRLLIQLARETKFKWILQKFKRVASAYRNHLEKDEYGWLGMFDERIVNRVFSKFKFPKSITTLLILEKFNMLDDQNTQCFRSKKIKNQQRKYDLL